MISAVVMAGYNNKREVRRYSRIVADHYGEKFIEAGYKPLREFKTLQNGRQISKPLIQYTLEKLYENELIDEIVIVGHQMLLEQKLRQFIRAYSKPCRIVNQNSKIPGDIIRRFKIKHSVFGHVQSFYEGICSPFSSPPQGGFRIAQLVHQHKVVLLQCFHVTV